MTLRTPEQVLKEQVKENYPESPFTKAEEKFIQRVMLAYSAEVVDYVMQSEPDDANKIQSIRYRRT